MPSHETSAGALNVLVPPAQEGEISWTTTELEERISGSEQLVRGYAALLIARKQLLHDEFYKSQVPGEFVVGKVLLAPHADFPLPYSALEVDPSENWLYVVTSPSASTSRPDLVQGRVTLRAIKNDKEKWSAPRLPNFYFLEGLERLELILGDPASLDRTITEALDNIAEQAKNAEK